MALRGFGTFWAQQRFELVHTSDAHYAETNERFRVSTREYLYKVVLDKGPEIRWHWHPQGNSPERRPHIHPSFNLKAHMPSGREALEDVIESCIELGATPSCQDYRVRLAETGGIHKLYRSWSDDPSEYKP
ncbi:hypothetical protein F8M49_25000 [Rhodococcus zopfii]|uniref:Uncharacterized protein n=1 Tax=Rhodococcus zopfii TaxID=43772 RepID=A0ABU3WV20_9NOCA|nr:hypothetical protein [Rhodococcus zopfii]